MKPSPRISIYLSTLVVLTGIVLCLRADPVPLPQGPTVTYEFKDEGQGPFLEGVAIAEDPELYVEVRAIMDGDELEGSPDTQMEGAGNHFVFPLPPDFAGKTICIVAEDEFGHITREYLTL